MKRLLCGAVLAAWLGLGSVGAASAAPPVKAALPGTISSVVDGDTVWFAPEGGGAPHLLRLSGIDAPESCQSGGPEAKAYLAELVLRQPVRLVPASPRHDRHGRLLGTLWAATVQVNRRLVEEGQAWSIRTKWDRGPYVTQERMAKALRRGFHGSPDSAEPPWDFRKRHGPCAIAPAVTKR